MTTKRIVYARPDGGVSVVCPAPAARKPNESLAKFVARISAKVVPNDAVNIEIIEAADLPSNREFRNAWEKPGVGVTISFAKAQTIARRILTRLVRQEMALLDDRRVQAEIEDDTTLVGQIDARKTALQATIIPQIRDGIAASTNLADLRAVKQAYLNGRPQAVKDALS